MNMDGNFNNLFNTLGVGEIVPPKKACLTGADYADDRFNGSGDIFPVFGMTPLSMWCKEWKDMREEYLEKQKNETNYSFSDERPLLVFSNEPLPNEEDYKPLMGGNPAYDKSKFE